MAYAPALPASALGPLALAWVRPLRAEVVVVPPNLVKCLLYDRSRPLQLGSYPRCDIAGWLAPVSRYTSQCR